MKGLSRDSNMNAIDIVEKKKEKKSEPKFWISLEVFLSSTGRPGMWGNETHMTRAKPMRTRGDGGM